MKVKQILAFLIMISLMFSCSKWKDGRTKIRFAHWGDIEEIKILNNIRENFEKENPDIKIVFEHSPSSEYRNKLLTQIAGGIGPDVAFLGTADVFEFSKKNVFLSLDDYIEKDNDIDKKQFYKIMMDACSYNGKLYILPRDTSPYCCIYYNKTLFDELGMAYPKDTWTINDFLSTAKKIMKTSPDGKPERFGFHTWMWEDFLYLFGGKMVDDFLKPKKFLLTSKKSLKGLQYYHDLMYKHKVMPSPVIQGSLDINMQMMFYTGKVGMLLSGIWETPSLLKNTKFDWDIAMFPGTRSGVGGGGSGYGITSTSKHKDQAWLAVKYFGGRAGQKELALAGLAQPAIREMALSEYWMDPNKTPKNKIILDKAVKYTMLAPRLKEWTEIMQTIINPNLELFFYDKIDINEFKKIVDKDIRKKYTSLEISE